MRFAALTVLAFALLGLAGCVDDSTTETLSFQETQCQDNPWGAGADAEAIAAHYGVDVSSAKEVDDSNMYAAVCDGLSSTHVVATVSGDVQGMLDDGWTTDPVS